MSRSPDAEILEQILDTIQQSCLRIHRTISATIPTIQVGETVTETNSSGDTQKPLDIVTNNIIIEDLKGIPAVAGLLSEELDDYLPCHPEGSFIISFDPLDGSGNSPLNLSTGSIFGVFRASNLADISGRGMVAASYSIYGAALETIRVTKDYRRRSVWVTGDSSTSGNGSSCEDGGGRREVILDNQITVPLKGKIYIANEGNSPGWSQSIQAYVSTLKGRSLRWMACFVADAHRILMEGGVYLYPEDTKQTSGKLRLVYEVYPIAFIWEQCGGRSLGSAGATDKLTSNDGYCAVNTGDAGDRVGLSGDMKRVSCLDVPFNPNNIHQRCPIFLFGEAEWHRWCECYQ